MNNLYFCVRYENLDDSSVLLDYSNVLILKNFHCCCLLGSNRIRKSVWKKKLFCNIRKNIKRLDKVVTHRYHYLPPFSTP